MFDLDDLIEDGVNIDEFYYAVDEARMNLKGAKGGAKVFLDMLESITDEIEIRGAMGEFDK